MSTSTVPIAEGVCYAVFAYDVGRSIDLARCPQRLTATAQRARIRPKHHTPAYFEYRPAPLHVIQETVALAVGPYHSHTSVDVVLYDFGAVSLTYAIPFQGRWPGLLALSEALANNPQLLHDARCRVEELLEALQDAVHRPHMADCVEDYAIFQIETFAPPCSAAELYTTYAQEVAQILRVEHVTLAAQEVQEAVSHRIAFGLEDVTIIDWHAALLLDREAEDVRAVLEFANVALLEMRYLDEQLDHALNQAYDTLSRRTWRGWRRLGGAADLQRIGRMQVDSAMLFEGVNNTLKLLGDQYLARVYRLASQRFHLDAWDASILRKLHTLESIYTKISDQVTNRRMEVLEWIIIVLIAVSMLLPFIPAVPRH